MKALKGKMIIRMSIFTEASPYLVDCSLSRFCKYRCTSLNQMMYTYYIEYIDIYGISTNHLYCKYFKILDNIY